MRWLIGTAVLVAVAFLLRRLLHMGPAPKAKAGGFGTLRAHLDAIYRPVAHEIEAHTTILGITLNEAFTERDANRLEMAWRVVRLAVGEWSRLTDFVLGVQNILNKHLPSANGVVPLRRISAGHFKSRTVIDYVGMYEFLDQVLFSSKQRFALQLRLLQRASAMLSKAFRLTCREGERSLDSSDEVWSRLDYEFHDFDLIAKETLLAFHTLLICLPPAALESLTLDLQALLDRGVRVSVPRSNQSETVK